MINTMKIRVLLVCVAVLAASDEVYKKPPKDVLEVLHALPTPRAIASPAHTHLLLVEPLRYPPIADLAQPMLRLAGLRINPATNGPHRGFWNKSMSLLRISDGVETRLQTPAGTRLSQPMATLGLIPKRSAACRRDMPSLSTAATTRSRRSIE